MAIGRRLYHQARRLLRAPPPLLLPRRKKRSAHDDGVVPPPRCGGVGLRHLPRGTPASSLRRHHQALLAKCVGEAPSDDELKEMMAKVDKDGSGKLDFDEVVVVPHQDDTRMTSAWHQDDAGAASSTSTRW